MEIVRKGNKEVLRLREYENKDGTALPVLYFPLLEETGIVSHFFTTRMGGVSEGRFRSMNLSFFTGDDRERVHENYRRIGAALGTDEAHMVLTCQMHHTNVIRVGEEQAGCGTVRERPWKDVDGLVTNEPGICLVTFFADCVPVMIVDPVHHAAGSAHSGWRGTAARMGKALLVRMREEFGTDPRDVVCGIGPSICADCYEVSDDVAAVFQKEFPGHAEEILKDKHNGHQMLNLQEACRITLLEEGVPKDQISVTDICTFENPDLLFSHRASRGTHGNFGGFLMLKG